MSTHPAGRRGTVKAGRQPIHFSLDGFFSKPEHEQKYAIKISSAAVVDLIRKMGEWSEEDNWNVPGIYFADEQALVYDLGAAFRPSPRGGWTAKRQKEAAAAAALSSAEATED